MKECAGKVMGMIGCEDCSQRPDMCQFAFEMNCQGCDGSSFTMLFVPSKGTFQLNCAKCGTLAAEIPAFEVVMGVGKENIDLQEVDVVGSVC